MKEYRDLGRLSFKTNLVIAVLKRRRKETKNEPIKIAEAREARKNNMTKICGKPLKGVKTSTVNFTTYPAYFYEPENLIDDEWTILYLHGGAYIGSDINVYNGFVSRFANDLKLKAYSFDYPLAPESQYPEQVQTVKAFYEKMIENGHDPKKIILAGDSAGGGLSLAVCFELRKAKLPLPAQIVLFSPWVDLTLSGETINSNTDKDLMVTKRLLVDASAFYAGEQDRKTPGISPLFGDFAGFPPVYILTTGDELLFSECEALHDVLEESGVDVYLSSWAKAQHAFIVGMSLFPEAKKVMQNIKAFIYGRAKMSDAKK